MKRILLCLAAALLMVVTPVLAADTPNLSAPVAYGTPVLDGVANDAAWLSASQLGAKVVVDQDNTGIMISNFPRVAYLTYDDENLYIGFIIATADSSKLVTNAGSFWNNDEVEVSVLAPGSSVYKITVIADGIAYEASNKVDGLAAVGTTATSCVIEMKMSFAKIGATPKAGDTWTIGINGHQVADGDMWMTWNPTYGGFSNTARFGYITFLAK